jgi:D-alanine-D-alanine ligase-like ATP-grasp enzyme
VRCAACGRSNAADAGCARRILRLSDPVMFRAAHTLSAARAPYIGPGYEAMKRCYDKYAASRLVAATGFTCPETELATEADGIGFPLVLKPRFGSDSIGLRRYARSPLPARKRSDRYIVQRYVGGTELTVGVLDGAAGTPLHICIPAGAMYTFMRKYLLRPRIVPLAERRLASRVRVEALNIAAALGVDWAARIDFIHDPRTDSLYFLECDVAPLVGAASAFAASLTAAGIGRSEQLERLFLNARNASAAVAADDA